MIRNCETFEVEQVKLKDIEGGMPTLRQMKNFEADKEKLSDDVENMLEDGDGVCKAFSLYQHGLIYSYRFITHLQDTFKDTSFPVMGAIKGNLRRIA